MAFDVTAASGKAAHSRSLRAYGTCAGQIAWRSPAHTPLPQSSPQFQAAACYPDVRVAVNTWDAGIECDESGIFHR